jgi:hypothetical protein
MRPIKKSKASDHGAVPRAPTPPPAASDSEEESDPDDEVVEVPSPPGVARAASSSRGSSNMETTLSTGRGVTAVDAQRARRNHGDDKEDATMDGPIPKKGKLSLDDDADYLSDDDVAVMVGVGRNSLMKVNSRSSVPPALTQNATNGRFLTAGIALSNALSDAVWMPQKSTSKGAAVDATSHLTSAFGGIAIEFTQHVVDSRAKGARTTPLPNLFHKVHNAITLAISPLYRIQKPEIKLNLLIDMPTLPVVVVTDSRYYHGFAVHGNWIYDVSARRTFCVPISQEELLDLGYLVAVSGVDDAQEEEKEKGSEKKVDEEDGKEKKKISYVVNPDVVQYAVVPNKDWLDQTVSEKDKKKEMHDQKNNNQGRGSAPSNSYQPPHGNAGTYGNAGYRGGYGTNNY